MPAAKPGAPVRAVALSAGAQARLRGIGGTEQAPASEAPKEPKRLADALTTLTSVPDRARDVWVWQTKLSNPSNQ